MAEDIHLVGATARNCVTDHYIGIMASDDSTIQDCVTAGYIQCNSRVSITNTRASEITIVGSECFIADNVVETIYISGNGNVVIRNLIKENITGNISVNQVAPISTVALATHPLANISN